MNHSSNTFRKSLTFSKLSSLLILLLVSLLTACGSNNGAAVQLPSQEAPVQTEAVTKEAAIEPSGVTASATRVVSDELGNELTIPIAPARVYSPYMEDSLVALGVTPVVQWANGDKPQTYLQDQLKDVPLAPFIGGDHPSPELVMSFEPDLIILHNAYYGQNGVYEQYSKIAPTYVFNNAAGDLENSIPKLGDLLGKPAEAQQALLTYHQKIDEAKTKLAPIIKGKKAALIRFTSRGMFLVGGNYFGGYVLSHELGIGKTKLVETENSADLSLEVIPQIDADFIFIANVDDTGTAFLQELTESAVWKSLPAVKNGQVFEVDDEYWLGSGLIAYQKIMDDVVQTLLP
jgi:iron complex transport system substrate-binding protein